MKKLERLILCLVLLTGFLMIEPAYAYYENVEEFEDKVLFKKTYLDLGTWERTWEKDLGIWGKLKTKAYFSLGKLYIKLPTKIRTKYDTTIEYTEENMVEMLIDTYNGPGKEFEFEIGADIYLKWSTIFGDLKVGDFPTGFDIDGDFEPPLGVGEQAYTGSDGAAASIGLYKALSLDVGFQVRLKIEGIEVYGGYWEDDPYVVAKEQGASGVRFYQQNTWYTQFSVHEDQLPISIPLDGYVDFGVNNLKYKVKYTVQIAGSIGLSVLGMSWSYTIPLWSDIKSFTDNIDVDSGNSDDTSYQMTRFFVYLLNEYGIPWYGIGPLPPVAANPGASIVVDIPIKEIAINLPSLFDIADTYIEVYWENGTLMKTISGVSRSDFLNGWISGITIDIPSIPDVDYHYIEFRLKTPEITSPDWFGDWIGAPDFVNATMMFWFRLPDLNILDMSLSISEGTTYDTYNIDVEVDNVGDIASPIIPSGVKLYLYDGIPNMTQNNFDFDTVIGQSTLIESKQLDALSPNQSQIVHFSWTSSSQWVGKDIAFIASIGSLNPVAERTPINNRAFVTTHVMDRQHDIEVTNVVPDKVNVNTGDTVNISVDVKNAGKQQETFTVDVFAGEELVGTKQKTLNAGSTTTLVFQWTTSTAGTFGIKAQVPPVNNEDDTLDNICEDDTVAVNPPFDFSISASPSSRIVTAGASTTYTVTVTLTGGTAETVSLSYSGCPSHTSCTFSPSQGNPTFISTLTVSTSTITPTGTHTLTITATGGGKTHSCSVQLTVNPPSPPVGGIWLSVDKFGLLAPYVGLASAIIVATAAIAICVKRVKSTKDKR